MRQAETGGTQRVGPARPCRRTLLRMTSYLHCSSERAPASLAEYYVGLEHV
jgi:hypothetical protein